MDVEGGSPERDSRKLRRYKTTLSLVYQSFGIVYGDLSTSPIYVFRNTFSGGLKYHEDDDIILGVLSVIFWTLTLIPFCKYIVFVLGADDNGEGGTFALYSLLCRNSKMGLINASHAAHEQLSTYSTAAVIKETSTSEMFKAFFEKHITSRVLLFLFVLLGTTMVIADGVLTPTMSVLSAVSGVQIKIPHLHESYTIFFSCLVLVGLFALQHYGTHRVGFLFAPILLAWLICVCGVGIYNIVRWNPGIANALSPYYVYIFFKKAGKDGWRSLGSVVLCVTGAEAMFADLGHFSRSSIRIAFTTVVYPCLVLAYFGEAAFLSKHKAELQHSFFKSIPEHIFWPVFLVATLATVVGSQAIISATFSLISQCRAIRCFPRVKIVHTSSQVHGQIYIPEVNWMLMFLCVAVVVGFRDIHMIGNAYGLAVITVMLVTTCLMFLIMVTVWKRHFLSALTFVLFFGSVELVYFSSCIRKVPKGGWLPLLVSLIASGAMSIWHLGTWKKEAYELQNKVCVERLLSLGPSLGIVRIPGIGLVYSNVVSGLPPMFAHFVTNFPAFHKILVFVTLKGVTVPKVPSTERFLIGRIGPPEYRLFRCIVRYGYKDARRDAHDFEDQLIVKIGEFLQREGESDAASGHLSIINTPSAPVVNAIGSDNRGTSRRKKVTFQGVGVKEEVKELVEAREAGVAYMMGQTCVVASDTSSWVKKLTINIVYSFLRRNCRRPAVALGIPHTSLIEVGMVYSV